MQHHARHLKTATAALVTAIAIAAVLVGPSAVLAKSDTGRSKVATYTKAIEAPSLQWSKFPPSGKDVASLRRTSPRQATEIPAPRVAATTHTLTTVSTGSTTSGGTSSDGTSSGGTSELAQAQSILAGYIAKYPILSGTTVSIGSTPGGYQAVAYYTVGKIVISSTHTASLQTILAHEIWHVIDYRDNGQIDWGENVPPSNYP